MSPALCRHCHAAPVSRPRRLCWNCYYEPAIRARYPSAIRIGLVAKSRRRLPPPYPTTAPPGSPEKIAVLAQRAQKGLELWHPDDAMPDQRLRARRLTCRVG